MNINETNYVDNAENVINDLREPENGKVRYFLTTSKIRNLLSMSADIYNEVMMQNEEKLSADINSRIDYLRVRFIYESGRDRDVNKFVEKAELISFLKSINSSKKRYILFYRYMESLVAFHKFYGGKD